ncbi:MAG: SurA N-terminal domain-containing protein, partial [Thermodesulfobacteriota bacterium]
MLSFMRRHARSWFIKVLLGTVIVVFIFFYGFNLWEREASVVASVNGVKIGLRDFRSYYERMLEAQRAQGAQLTPEQLRLLKEATLDTLVEEMLVVEVGERWGLSVPDAELRDFIVGIPAFQEEGQFSNERFQFFLRSRGETEEGFARSLRRQLLVRKGEDLIRDCAKVRDDDVKVLQDIFNDRVVLQYVVLGPATFSKEISPTQGEIEGYFKEHLSDYRIPETAKVQYMRFDPATYADQVEVTEKELEERYQATQQRWKESRQVLARHILLRSTEQDDPKARMTVLQKAENLLKRLKDGEDFAKLAKEHSQDSQTASKGGLLGWKRQGELPEALDKALFDEMSPGQLSERPVKSPEGFHLLKLEEVRAERVRPFAEVKEVLRKELIQEKAKEQALETAKKAYMEVFKGGEFEKVAKEFLVPVEEPSPIPMQGSLKGLQVGEPFRKATFSLKEKDDFSEVVEERIGFLIIRLLERSPSRDAQLSEVIDRVREDLKRIKGTEKAKEEAERLVQELRSGKTTLEEVAK